MNGRLHENSAVSEDVGILRGGGSVVQQPRGTEQASFRRNTNGSEAEMIRVGKLQKVLFTDAEEELRMCSNKDCQR